MQAQIYQFCGDGERVYGRDMKSLIQAFLIHVSLALLWIRAVGAEVSHLANCRFLSMQTIITRIHQLRLAVVISSTCLLLPNLWAGPSQILNLATNEQIAALAISPDGTKLAVSAFALVREAPNSGTFRFQGGVELWDISSAKLIGSLHQRPWQELDDTNTESYNVRSLEFSPDGNQLAATDGKGVVLWDAASGTELFRWRSGVPDPLLSPGWSPDGKWLALPSMEQDSDDLTNGIALIEIATGKREAFFPVDNGYARVARISPDGKLLATAGQDCTVRVFDLAARTNVFEDNIQGNIFTLSFSRDGRYLVAPDWGGSLRLYDVMRQTERILILKRGSSQQKTRDEVHQLEFTSDGRNALSIFPEQNVRIWNTLNWTSVGVMSGCLGGRLSHDGTKVVLVRESAPSAIELWSLPELIHTVQRQTTNVGDANRK